MKIFAWILIVFTAFGCFGMLEADEPSIIGLVYGGAVITFAALTLAKKKDV